jgi:hypothetical protein
VRGFLARYRYPVVIGGFALAVMAALATFDERAPWLDAYRAEPVKADAYWLEFGGRV